jgi:hypothetical protein
VGPAPAFESVARGGDGRAGFGRSPRATSAITRSSIGDTSSNRSADATRSPPIQ